MPSLAQVSDAEWATLGAVLVALVTAFFGWLTAMVTRPAKEAAKAAEATSAEAAKKAEKVANALGTPNGKGNVVEMSEKQLELLARIAVDVADLSTSKSAEYAQLRSELQAGQAATAAGLHDVVEAMDHHGARIERIEKRLALPPLDPKEPT